MIRTDSGKLSAVAANSARKSKRGASMPEITQLYGVNPIENTPVYEMVKQMSQSQRERLFSAEDREKLGAVFADEELMNTFDAYLLNGMNISETARILYMHRNTLMYRLNKLRDMTGMDIRRFDVAVTVCVLRLLYNGKRG